jgi:hypothetical protein
MDQGSNLFVNLILKKNLKIKAMKKVSSLLIIATLVIAHSCKQEESDRFKYLTGTVWTPVSLLANGVDATGPDGILAGFVGDAKFNEDGTGTFGTYSGEWMFASAEEKLSITSMSPPVSLILNIIVNLLKHPSSYREAFPRTLLSASR